MDEIKALKSESSTISPSFNNQLAALELLEVEASPPFEETLPERVQRSFSNQKSIDSARPEHATYHQHGQTTG